MDLSLGFLLGSLYFYVFTFNGLLKWKFEGGGGKLNETTESAESLIIIFNYLKEENLWD